MPVTGFTGAVERSREDGQYKKVGQSGLCVLRLCSIIAM